MSRAVLISIQPKWCDLIASGRKTIELRKTRPKLDTPFKCYIYQTRGDAPCEWVDGKLICKSEKCAKVIGEFVCDRISTIAITDEGYDFDCPKMTGLSYEAMADYLNQKEGYGWHISELKIYDKPKELSAFYRTCPGLNYAGMCWTCDKAVGEEHDCGVNGEVHLSRPPQSWCYVYENN